MKIFVKLLLLALVAAIAAPFFIKGPNGQPLLNFQDVISGNGVIADLAPKKETKIYQWKNSKGELQFGDTPPTDTQSSQIQVQTQINSMKSVELPDGYKEESGRQPRFDPLSSSASPLSTAPIEKVPEMLEQIEGYQQTLDARSEMLDSL